MPIKILLAIPTLNRKDRLTRMLETVAASTRQPDQILIVNNGGQCTDSDRLNWNRYFNLDVYTPHTNLGVAGSVNFAMRNVPDGWYFLHANDDIEYEEHCIERMAAAAEQNPDTFCVPDHGVGSAFTTFLIPQFFTEVIGYFDPQFFPAYFEDNDLGLRMNMDGVKRVVVKDAVYIHHTSSTRRADDEDPAKVLRHHELFRENEKRYIAKWGGLPDHETFDLPYNGERGHTPDNFNQWHKETFL